MWVSLRQRVWKPVGEGGGASSGGLREMPIDGKSSRENTRVREA